MAQKKKYDLAFGLGIACSCSQSLRAAGLQYLSFPYDWITIDPDDAESVKNDLLIRVAQIKAEFADWFKPEDFVYQKPIPTIGKDLYFNKRLKLVFNHDFPMGIPYEKAFPVVLEKYQRRYSRLLSLIRASKRVLVLRVERPDFADHLTLETVREAQAQLETAFPKTRFDFLILTFEQGRTFEQRLVEKASDSITRVTFDYKDYTAGSQPHQVKLRAVGDYLFSLFAVRDYRTKEERQAFRKRNWAKKCKRFGVESRAAYELFRIKRFLLGPCNLGANLLAHLRQKKFEQIVLLGYNCETAFRFVNKWDFLDSSLFSWASTHGIKNLVSALRSFDQNEECGMTYDPHSGMWKDTVSGCHFHGKLHSGAGSPLSVPTQEELDADLTDLRGRLQHLREKFKTYAQNDKSTLFILKIMPQEEQDAHLNELLNDLENALLALGAKNWKLLVICERTYASTMPKGLNRIFRSVLKFNSDSCVIDHKTGDQAGWNRIFTEFAPTHILKRAHKFKYEV